MLEHRTKETECGLSERLPTPTSSDYRDQPTSKSWKAKGAINFKLSNPEIRAKWPTPVHSEARQGLQIRRDGKKGTQQSLTTAVMTWPTPRTAGMCGGSGSWDLLNKNTTVEEARLMGAGNGGQLNPPWVEWLMGWPIGWTDLKPLGMDKSPSVPQVLGDS